MVVCIRTSFLFMAEQNSTACIYINISNTFCLIHLFVDGHLNCFQLLIIVNNAAMNTGIQYNWHTNRTSIYLDACF